MAHRVAPGAEAELDDIWYYIATESGSVGIADRVIDSIAERFSFLPAILMSDAVAMTICVPVCGVLLRASISLSTVLIMRTY